MSICLVSGDDDFNRRRFIRECESSFLKKGYAIERYGGGDREGLSSLLMGSGFFFRKGGTIAVIETMGDVEVDLLVDYHETPTALPNVLVLVHCQTKAKAKSDFSKLVKKLPKKQHKVFTAPSFWKLDEAAAEFCVEEAKRFDVSIKPKFAAALVERVGSDFGILSFEIQKAAILLKETSESDAIDGTILRHTMAVISEAAVFLPLTTSLGSKNQHKTLRILSRIEQTHRGDPTMRVIGSLYKTIVLWFQAADLSERGVVPDKAAQLLGLNSWRHKNIILPYAKRWGTAELFDLVQHFAAAQRVVLVGSINPWLYFVSGVMRSVSEAD